jgi:hypothetical protein
MVVFTSISPSTVTLGGPAFTNICQ